jgi:diadenosine tetraphosphate (Ap4A) HIT family hydrolase
MDISPATRGHALVVPRNRLPWKPEPCDSNEIAAAAEQLR